MVCASLPTHSYKVLVPRLRLEELRDSNAKIRSPTSRRHKTATAASSSSQQQQPSASNPSSSGGGGNGRGGGGSSQEAWSRANGGFSLADLSQVTSLDHPGGMAPPDSSKSADVVLPSPRSAFSETVRRGLSLASPPRCLSCSSLKSSGERESFISVSSFADVFSCFRFQHA